MEDVLEVYHREFDDDTVLVCMDETSKQQTKETRTPRPVRPGQPAIVDFEYERNGVANLFIVFAPLLGWRWVKVTDRRTRHDWAHLIPRTGGRHLPRQENRSGDGQPEHPFPCIAL